MAAILLQQLWERGQNVALGNLSLPDNNPLLTEIQTRLSSLGLLDPVIDGNLNTPFRPVRLADGRFGADTRNAIAAFHRYARLPFEETLLTPAFFKTIADATPANFLPVEFDAKPGDDPQIRLAKAILRYMDKKGYWIARAPDMLNIVYVEGVDADGKPNKDLANEWNDRRTAFRILPGGKPEMLINDQATSEPGLFYTMQPMRASGVARMAFGQYKAWMNGHHRGTQPALVQRGNVRLHRDLDKNGIRNAADKIDIGSSFGINQHSTSPQSIPALVNKYSAGCLVGRRYRWHLSFMHIVRQDYRYVMNPSYMFISTVIAGDELI